MQITDGFDLIDPGPYAEKGVPHELWTRLRREAPVHHCAPPGYGPFWAITRHADICEISKRPDTFLSAPGIVMVRNEDLVLREASDGIGAMRTIIEMDPPEHRSLRKVASPWFTPRALQRIDAVVEASARELVDKLAGPTGEGECDFATDVAAAHPLRILSAILGVPREQEPAILRMTNELFASDDPELGRDSENRQEAIKALGLEMYQLFDTTKNALAGGMCALARHPDELAKLRRDPDLVAKAVEEIVRWTTPVNYMKRTAARDVELPNRHLGIGIGEHFCRGAHLARRSQQALFRELCSRLEFAELTGEPEQIRSSFVVGLKHLPLRYRIARRA